MLALFLVSNFLILSCAHREAVLNGGSWEADLKALDLPSLKKEYPNAGVVYLLDEKKDEVFENGRSKTTLHAILKVIHERGKEKENIRIFFNSHRQTASIVYARTMTPEGHHHGPLAQAGKNN